VTEPATGRRSPPRVLGLIWVGAAINLMLIWLGLVTPFADPNRTRVDNALLLLGVLGLVNALLLVRTRLISLATRTRVALACYAGLSAAAVALADFGASRAVGWGIKAVVLAILLFTLRDLAVASDR
jgi:CDP-diglyceride synthetase